MHVIYATICIDAYIRVIDRHREEDEDEEEEEDEEAFLPNGRNLECKK